MLQSWSYSVVSDSGAACDAVGQKSKEWWPYMTNKLQCFVKIFIALECNKTNCASDYFLYVWKNPNFAIKFYLKICEVYCVTMGILASIEQKYNIDLFVNDNTFFFCIKSEHKFSVSQRTKR